MLQVRENEISLRKWSGGSANLRSYGPQRVYYLYVITVV